MSCGMKPIKNPMINSMAVCAFKCSLEVAMAPVRINIMANVPLMLMLKWILKAIKNINNPAIDVICILALIFINTKKRHASVDINIPTKK